MKKQAILALTLCLALGTGCGKEEVAEEKVLRSVETTTVGKSAISSAFTYSGKAAPSKEVAVVPTIPGKVTGFRYEVGDKVGENAVLFTVDDTDLQNNLRSLEANYHVARLGYDNAKNTYENNLLLYEEEIISKQEIDQLQYAYESAEAQLASIQVQIDNLKKNIADCAVKSPMSGVIATRGVERGGFASQGAPAYTVMDLSVIKVEVGVSEQTVNTISVGDTVDVKMTAVSEEPLKGKVSTISPAAGQTGTYTVKVTLDNRDGKIKAGMLAEVSFTVASASQAIVLPMNAVLTKEGETYVYTLENGRAKKTPVTLGIESGETVEITEGLSDGMEVVTKGQTYISDGEEVTVIDKETGRAKTDLTPETEPMQGEEE
ncbi:MAG: efflux RND transporter periplasmic adaptor subunit [Anaerotignum sp.]|nr:efflux RND transporter periplasmic adaptor subunit [Anaerotignum sp.]